MSISKTLDKNLFNIELLIFNDENTKYFKEVKTGAIFETGTKLFHRDGLFSTDIFGPIGSRVRSEREAVIDLKLPVLHPLIYELIISLNSKIERIANGKTYAIFNNTIGDFEISTKENGGRTGYSFLLEHIDKIKFTETNSTERKYKIELCKKYCNTKSLITKWAVIPAGLRDYTEDKKGTPSEDEINGIYRKLITSANMLSVNNLTQEDLKLLDPIRLRTQKTLVELYEYLKSLLDGKSKFIQSKFIKRATMYGTRNVLTPSPAKITDLTDDKILKSNHTTVGLYQYIKAITPITMNLILTKFLNKIFNSNSNNAYLINKETLRSYMVEIPIRVRDKWLTFDGLTEIMNKLAQPTIRENPVTVNGDYLMLVYDRGNKIDIITDTKDISFKKLDKNKIRPITYGELFYITVEDVVDKYPAFTTRYPVAGLGGIYPCWVYLKTTTTGRRVELTYNGITRTAIEYPILGKSWVESMAVDGRNLELLGGDHDGDTLSFTVLFSQESRDEITKFLNSKSAYISAENKIIYSSSDNVIELVMSSMTE